MNGVTIVSNGVTYNTNTGSVKTTTAYECFCNMRPDVSVLGELWYGLFSDAVRSFVLNYFKIQNKYNMESVAKNIEIVSDRYARLYFASQYDEKAIIMFKCVLKDILDNYNATTSMNKDLELIYDAIVRLIKV